MKYFLTHSKIDRVLHFILILFLLISFRIWHLCVIQKDERIKEAAQPQKRTILERAKRGAIYDRTGVPLALNRIRYRASIYYAHLRQIPSFAVEKRGGETIRRRPRKEHIRLISELLAKELKLDAERIEDLIYSKAALLPHIPFAIKENISEQEYYRLKMLEKNFTGLYAEISPERFYPQSSTAADAIGYMGAISQKEYQNITQEIHLLEEEYQENQNQEGNIFRKSSQSLEKLQQRLKELKTKVYQINDFVGKSGLEGVFEKDLRGFHGHKNFAVDIQSNFLKELDNSQKACEGKTLHTTIIYELQKYAEELLKKDEIDREGKSRYYSLQKKQTVTQSQPGIKGGAIVVIEPTSGEILTLATYPCFDPNDFAVHDPEHTKKRVQWLENPLHIQQIFDGKAQFTISAKEKKELSWALFADNMALNNPGLKKALQSANSIQKAALLSEEVEELLYLAKTKNTSLLFDLLFFEHKKIPQTLEKTAIENALFINQTNQNKETIKTVEKIKKHLDLHFDSLSSSSDMLFLLDLLRIAVYSPSFSDQLLKRVGHFSLDYYWDFSKKTLFLKEQLRDLLKPLFHKVHFSQFKDLYQKEFLRIKREEEREKKLYPRPYLDYLDQIENKLFSNFFEKNCLLLLTSWIKQQKPKNSELEPFFDFLNEQRANFASEISYLEKALKELDFELSHSFLKTVRSFNQLERPLLGTYPQLKKASQEKDLARLFYPQSGFGFMSSFAYKKSAPLGSVFKIVPAWAALKKQYLSLNQNSRSTENLNPFSMIDTRTSEKLVVGYTLDHKPYTRYYKGGRLPASSARNMGQIDLVSAIEQSSNPYFSLLAGDFLDGPEDLLAAAQEFSFGEKTGLDLTGESKGLLPDDLPINKTGLYSFAMGQHSFEATPLQTAVMLATIANGGKVLKPKLIKEDPTEIKRKLFLPKAIRKTILEGLDRVLWGEKGTARPLTIQKLRDDPALKAEYKTLAHEMLGKTSTSEFMHKMGISPSVKAEKYKDIWFGGFSFKNGSFEQPELVVVVYLRYGSAGREAAPIGAQIVKKYRELKTKTLN